MWLCRRDRQAVSRSEEHTSELQSHVNLVCRLLLEKKNLMLTWVLVKQPQLVGKDNQTISFDQVGNQRPKRIVVAKTTLIGHHRVVFVDDGHHTVIQKCAFFFNDTATTEIYTLSLHDALPI